MKLLGLVVLVVAGTVRPARADTFTCAYDGSWTSAKKATGKMSWTLVWESAASAWKLSGEFDDADGHARLTGTCANKKCELDQVYSSGKLAKTTLYWSASYTDPQAAAKNVLAGTWGSKATDRTSAGTWMATATCSKGAAAGLAFEPLLGAGEGALVKALGAASKGEVNDAGLDGDYTWDWKWPAKGISITLSAGDKTGAFTARSIAIESGASKTKEGIGIGATKDAVTKAYATRINKKLRTPGNEIFVGAAPKLLVFELDGGKVVHIEYTSVDYMYRPDGH